MSGTASDDDEPGANSPDSAKDAPRTDRDASSTREDQRAADEVTEPHEDTPISPPGVQDGPALAMHTTDDAGRLEGLIAQLRADVAGENAATVEQAVRRRLDEVGLSLDGAEIDRVVTELTAPR